MILFLQDGQAADATQSYISLGWIDVTAISVLAVFFVLGLFKGIVWQTSRVAILVAAYLGAVKLGHGFGEVLLSMTHSGPEPATGEQADAALYVACVLIFLGVLIVLSLLSMLLQNLVKKAGLGFYDRLFGGLLGIASGALVVLGLHIGVRMFFPPQSRVAAAAKDSHSLRIAKEAVAVLGDRLPVVRDLLEGKSPSQARRENGVTDGMLPPGVLDLPAEASGRHAGTPVPATSDRDEKR